ncbi:gluconokinase [Pelagibacterium lentulum]|uniref:Gluconokinase n=2 Tax=Pelagibacterium lentulum TaxID=2029865 RepID=A0A916RLD4_9HYPH|nr:gluconokinase [Pelagibacterium lentulum]GGA60860.1 gluconokinase [Pelagibacterium lentulum]
MSMAQSQPLSEVRLIIVMGVSGSGKSTIGEALAEKTGAAFIDADHLHPPSNVDKMRGGAPLEDEDRWPWLKIVAEKMRETANDNGRVFCACSALKRAYRDFITEKADEPVLFVLLHGDKAVIAERQANRPGHFMPAALLDSQFATLEMFEADELGLTFDVAKSIDELVGEISASIE